MQAKKQKQTMRHDVDVRAVSFEDAANNGLDPHLSDDVESDGDRQDTSNNADVVDVESAASSNTGKWRSKYIREHEGRYIINDRWNGLFSSKYEQVKAHVYPSIKDDMERKFKNYLKPEGESATDNDYAFGVVQISSRVKSLASILRNFCNDCLAANTLEEQEKIDVKFMKLTSQDLLPSSWCHEVSDMLGLRIIVRAPRHKFQVYRATRYLGQLSRSRGYMLSEMELPAIFEVNDKPWKYFDPPSARSYYRPGAVLGFQNAIKAIASNWDGILSNGITNEFVGEMAPLRYEHNGNIRFEFKESGYSTLQTNLVYLFDSVNYEFELQVRTVLEHAWSEPEHSMIYKGSPLSEKVRGSFRNYGLALNAADDTLQLVIDEWRLESDERADYGERALRTFQVDKPVHGVGPEEKDLKLLYDYLRLGYITDAIQLAERWTKEYSGKPGIKHVEWAMEEIVCRMCNVNYVNYADNEARKALSGAAGDVKSTKKTTNLPEDDRLTVLFELIKKSSSELNRLVGKYREAQFKLLISEAAYVGFKRFQTKSSFMSDRLRAEYYVVYERFLTGAYNLIREVLHEIPEAKKRDVFPNRTLLHVFPVEAQLLYSRVLQWQSRFEENEPSDKLRMLKDSFEELQTAFTVLGSLRNNERDHKLTSLKTYNDIDIATINSMLWNLRLRYDLIIKAMNHHKLVKDTGSQQLDEIREQIKVRTKDMHDVLTSKENPEEVRASREALARVLEAAYLGDIDEALASQIKKCNTTRLKVLDTYLGLRDVSRTHEYMSTVDPPSPPFEEGDKQKKFDAHGRSIQSFNQVLRRSIIQVASRGEYTYDIWFAYSLLGPSRLQTM